MKILFLTKELPFPVNSGARMRTWHYVRGLAKAGEVYLICYGKRDGQEDGIKAMRQIGVDVIFEEAETPWQTLPKLLARLCSLFIEDPFAVMLRYSKTMQDKIRAVAQECQADVLICDGIHMSVNVPFDLTCRKILDEHNVESVIIKRFSELARNPFVRFYAVSEWWKFQRFENRCWPRFDEIHVCSAVDKEQVEKRSGHGNVKVVPNGVSCADFGTQDTGHRTQEELPVSCDMCHVTPNEKQAFRLVYSGLMGWTPNDDATQYFIKEIWPLIKSSPAPQRSSAPGTAGELGNPASPAGGRGAGAPVSFTVVGKDPTDALKELAAQDPSITVTGFVDDVKSYVMNADVFVVPLRIGSGTRLKILEAMAMGIAVVSTAIGCEGLDVTHGKNILIADDPKDFAGCVLDLLNDPQRRASIAAAGRKLVEEKYDWEIIEKDLGRIIRDRHEFCNN